MTFDRPFDRSWIGTDAYSSAPANAPAIEYERLFDRVCSIPLIPYSDRSPRARLRAPLVRPAFEHGYAVAPLAFKRFQQCNLVSLTVRCPPMPIHDTFPCMTNTAVAQTAKKPARERPIGRKLQQAIDLLLNGTCKSQRAVCDRLGLSESYLSRSMKSEKIRAFIARRTSESIAAGVLPATATVIRLVSEAKSEHVQFDAAKHLLALNGHRVGDGPSVNVNIGGGVGYVIKLAARDAEVFEGEVTDGVGGVLYGRKMTDQERRDGVEERSLPDMIDVTPSKAGNGSSRHLADTREGQIENASQSSALRGRAT